MKKLFFYYLLLVPCWLPADNLSKKATSTSTSSPKTIVIVALKTAHTDFEKEWNLTGYDVEVLKLSM